MVDLPNPLANPQPARPVGTSRPLLLCGLLVCCLLPRALMAWKLGGLCPDGVAYIRVAQSFDRGGLAELLRHAPRDPLPVVLAVLHRSGLDWEVAGEAWGVLMASLVVLPLFGWLRRQFDQRIALAGCLLYAVHSELIRWSPEVIRDPTFWFLATLSLYLSWRAVTEVRCGLFFAAGAETVMATSWRFEGLLLLLPLGLWSYWRWRALRQCRGRLLAGLCCCLGAAPALALLLSVVWLRGHAVGDVFRLRPLVLAGGWLHTLPALLLGDASVHSDVLPKTLGSISFARMLEIYLPTVFKGLTPLFVLLFGLGVVASWPTWKRRDNVPLLVAQVLLLLAIWVHLWSCHVSCKRYVFPLVLLSCGFAGMGLLRLSAVAARLAEHYLPALHGKRLFGAVPAIAALALALLLAFSFDSNVRAEKAALGRWIRDAGGPTPALFGPNGYTQVVNYYAQARCASFLVGAGDDVVLGVLRDYRPDLVVLPQDQADFRPEKPLLCRMEAAGFEPLDGGRVPRRCGRVLVLVRSQPAGRMPETNNGL